MLYGSRPAYTHQVVNDGTAVRNEIIRHYAILPNPVQKVNTFALVNAASGELRFADKKTQYRRRRCLYFAAAYFTVQHEYLNEGNSEAGNGNGRADR